MRVLFSQQHSAWYTSNDDGESWQPASPEEAQSLIDAGATRMQPIKRPSLIDAAVRSGRLVIIRG